MKKIICILSAATSCVSAEVDSKAFSEALVDSKAHEVVAKFVSEDPAEAITYVKQAIVASEASAAEVALIVKEGITAAPDEARLIYTSALAVAPDAHDEVLKVYYELTSNKGAGYSDAKGLDLSKDAKNAKGAHAPDEAPPVVVQNPLDFPTGLFANNEVALTPGATGGWPLISVLESHFAVQTAQQSTSEF